MAVKFMQSLDHGVFVELNRIARERGITMQELIRAVIVPDWMGKFGNGPRKTTISKRTLKRPGLRRKIRVLH